MNRGLPVSPALAQTIRTPSPAALELAKALVSPEAGGRGLIDVLYDEDASWVHCEFNKAPRIGDARHQTLRDGGIAPDYPMPEAMLAGTSGRLCLTRAELALHPDDPAGEAIIITPGMLRRVVFYSDVFEIEATGLGTLAVRTVQNHRIDAVFQAYFWPKALPIR